MGLRSACGSLIRSVRVATDSQRVIGAGWSMADWHRLQRSSVAYVVGQSLGLRNGRRMVALGYVRSSERVGDDAWTDINLSCQRHLTPLNFLPGVSLRDMTTPGIWLG